MRAIACVRSLEVAIAEAELNLSSLSLDVDMGKAAAGVEDARSVQSALSRAVQEQEKVRDELNEDMQRHRQLLASHCLDSAPSTKAASLDKPSTELKDLTPLMDSVMARDESLSVLAGFHGWSVRVMTSSKVVVEIPFTSLSKSCITVVAEDIGESGSICSVKVDVSPPLKDAFHQKIVDNIFLDKLFASVTSTAELSTGLLVAELQVCRMKALVREQEKLRPTTHGEVSAAGQPVIITKLSKSSTGAELVVSQTVLPSSQYPTVKSLPFTITSLTCPHGDREKVLRDAAAILRDPSGSIADKIELLQMLLDT